MNYYTLDLEKIHQSPDCITMFDKDLNIMTWNNACVDWFRISEENAVGKPLLELFPHIKTDYRVNCFRSALSNNNSYYFPNVPYTTIVGYYSQLILPISDKTNTVTRVMNIVRDHHKCTKYVKDDLLQPILRNCLIISIPV